LVEPLVESDAVLLIEPVLPDELLLVPMLAAELELELSVVVPVDPVTVPESVFVLGFVALGVVVELGDVIVLPLLGDVVVLDGVGVRPVVSEGDVLPGVVVEELPGPLVPDVPVPLDCA
jgi:hypothetical protein